jgi:hypothetical protein
VDYRAHYDRLIERARNRMLDGYVERHHIIPRCIGGSDERSNVVQLTAAEHYVAHQLLVKLHPGVRGLIYAATIMCGNAHGQRSNRLYAWLRARAATAQAERSRSMWANPEYRDKHKASMDRVRCDPEYRAMFSRIHEGRVKSEQERANIAEAGRNRAPRKFSEQAKANMAAARRKTWEERRAAGTHLDAAAKTRAKRIANGSYAHTPEQRARIGAAQIGRVPWNKGVTGYRLPRTTS